MGVFQTKTRPAMEATETWKTLKLENLSKLSEKFDIFTWLQMRSNVCFAGDNFNLLLFSKICLSNLNKIRNLFFITTLTIKLLVFKALSFFRLISEIFQKQLEYTVLQESGMLLYWCKARRTKDWHKLEPVVKSTVTFRYVIMILVSFSTWIVALLFVVHSEEEWTLGFRLPQSM